MMIRGYALDSTELITTLELLRSESAIIMEQAIVKHEACSSIDGYQPVNFFLANENPTAIPYAYILPDGSWHEKPHEFMPEEVAYFDEQFYFIRQNVNQPDFKKRMDQWDSKHPWPETAWSREFRAACHQHSHLLVVILDCHR